MHKARALAFRALAVKALLNEVLTYILSIHIFKGPRQYFHHFEHFVAGIVSLTDENDSVISCSKRTTLT